MPSGLDALREERRRFAGELAVMRSNANTTRGSESSVVLDDSSEWRPGDVALEPSADPSTESTASGIAKDTQGQDSIDLASPDLSMVAISPGHEGGGREGRARRSAALSVTARPTSALDHAPDPRPPPPLPAMAVPEAAKGPPEADRAFQGSSGAPTVKETESASEVFESVSKFLQAKRAGIEQERQGEVEAALQHALSGLAKADHADGSGPGPAGLMAARSYLEEVTNMLYGREIAVPAAAAAAAGQPPLQPSGGDPGSAEGSEGAASGASPDTLSGLQTEARRSLSPAGVRSHARSENADAAATAAASRSSNPQEEEEEQHREEEEEAKLPPINSSESPPQAAGAGLSSGPRALHASLDELRISAERAGRSRLAVLTREWTPPRLRPDQQGNWVTGGAQIGASQEGVGYPEGGGAPLSRPFDGDWDGSPSPQPRRLPARLFPAPTPATGSSGIAPPIGQQQRPHPPPPQQHPQQQGPGWAPAVQPWWPGPQVPPGVAWMPCWAPWGMGPPAQEQQQHQQPQQAEMRSPAGQYRDTVPTQAQWNLAVKQMGGAAPAHDRGIGMQQPYQQQHQPQHGVEESAGVDGGGRRRQRVAEHLEGVKNSFWELAAQVQQQQGALSAAAGSAGGGGGRLVGEERAAGASSPSSAPRRPPEAWGRLPSPDDADAASDCGGSALEMRGSNPWRGAEEHSGADGAVAQWKPPSDDSQGSRHMEQQKHRTMSVYPGNQLHRATQPPAEPNLPPQMQQTFARAYGELHRDSLLMGPDVVPLPEPELHRAATTAAARALGGAYDYSGALADLEELHLAAESLAKETKIESQQRKQESNLLAVYGGGPALSDDATFEDVNALQEAVSKEVEARIAAAHHARSRTKEERTKERYAAHTASWRAARRGGAAAPSAAESPPVRPSVASRRQRERSRSPLRGLSARDPLPPPPPRSTHSRIPRRTHQAQQKQHQAALEEERYERERLLRREEQHSPLAGGGGGEGQTRVHVAFGTRVKAPAPSSGSPPSPKPSSRAALKAPRGFVPRVAGLKHQGKASGRSSRRSGSGGGGGGGGDLHTISEEPAGEASDASPSAASPPLPLLRPSARQAAREAVAETRKDFLQQVARAAGLVPADIVKGAGGLRSPQQRGRIARPRPPGSSVPSVGPRGGGTDAAGPMIAALQAVGGRKAPAAGVSFDEEFVSDFIAALFTALMDKEEQQGPPGGGVQGGPAAAAAVIARALGSSAGRSGAGGAAPQLAEGGGRKPRRRSNEEEEEDAVVLPRRTGKGRQQQKEEESADLQRVMQRNVQQGRSFEAERDIVSRRPCVGAEEEEDQDEEKPEGEAEWRTGPQEESVEGDEAREHEEEVEGGDGGGGKEDPRRSEESVAKSVEDWVASRVAAEMIVRQMRQRGETEEGEGSDHNGAATSALPPWASAAALAAGGAEDMDPAVRELLTYEAIGEIVGEVVKGTEGGPEALALLAATGIGGDGGVVVPLSGIPGDPGGADMEEALLQLVLGAISSAGSGRGSSEEPTGDGNSAAAASEGVVPEGAETDEQPTTSRPDSALREVEAGEQQGETGTSNKEPGASDVKAQGSSGQRPQSQQADGVSGGLLVVPGAHSAETSNAPESNGKQTRLSRVVMESADGQARSTPAASVHDESEGESGGSAYSNSFEEEAGVPEEEDRRRADVDDIKRRTAVQAALAGPSAAVVPPRGRRPTTPAPLPSKSPSHLPAPLAVTESLDYALTDDEGDASEAGGRRRAMSPATPTTPDVSSSLMALMNAPALEFGLAAAAARLYSDNEADGPGHRRVVVLGAAHRTAEADSQAVAAEVAPAPITAVSRPPLLHDPATPRLWRPASVAQGPADEARASQDLGISSAESSVCDEQSAETPSASDDSADSSEAPASISGGTASQRGAATTAEERLAQLAERRRELMRRAGGMAAGDESLLLAGESIDLSNGASTGPRDHSRSSASKSTDDFDLAASIASDDSVGMWVPPQRRIGHNSSSEYAGSNFSLSSSTTSFSR